MAPGREPVRSRDRKNPENPYKLLPSLNLPRLERKASDTGETRSVTDVVEAMRAYQDMIYGLNMNAEGHRERNRALLIRYCRLDTLAQVIIWDIGKLAEE